MHQILEAGCSYPNRLLVIVPWSPGAFGIRNLVSHKQSSSCQHSPALPNAGSIFRLILERGWTADQGEPSAGRWCKQQRRWPQACPWYCFHMQPCRALCPGVDFLVQTLHSHPSQIWTILCALPKSRVNEYIQRPLENTKTRKGIWFSPTLSVRESAEK